MTAKTKTTKAMIEVTTPETVPEPVAPPVKVEVLSSEPPERPNRRAEDRRWWAIPAAIGRWLLAPLVEPWRGLSQTRLLALGVFLGTIDVAHRWVDKVAVVGWAFTIFVLGGFFLAAVLAFGAKYFDKLLTIVAAKVGVILTNAPGVPHG